MRTPKPSRMPAETTAEAPTRCWWLFGTASFTGLFAWAMLVGWTLVDASWWRVDAALTFVWALLTFGVPVAAGASCSLWALLILPTRSEAL